MALTQITEKGIKDGEIINADINASAAIAGSKIAPAFTSNLSITNANPNIIFLDSDANSDFKIDVNGGLFSIKDHTNADASRLTIDSSGTIKLNQADSLIHTNSNSSRLRLFGGSNESVSNGAALTLHGVSHSSGNYADLAAATGGHIQFRTGTSERMRLTSDGNIAFNRPNATVGDTQSGNSTATPKRFVFNNDHSSGYTDGSLKLYLFNGGTTRHGFTSGPNYDLQYHSSGSATEAKHTFFTQNTERLRIASDGKLSIDRTHASATTGNHPALDIDTHANGTAGATFATGIDFRIAGVHKKRLAITNADSSTGTGDWVFYRDNGSNEGIRILNGGGITFNGDTAAANALDDYEEGTFTPAITAGLSAGQVAYNSRSGHYTKIGRIVYFTFHINISSAVFDSGGFKFGGLPFTAVNDSNQAGGMFFNYSTGNFGTTHTWKVVGNATDIQAITSAGDAVAANSTSFNTNNRQVSFSGFYRV